MRRHGQDGFSMIELVVVLMIVVIMTGMVVPLYQGSITWARRDRATRDVLARMKYAQERAIADVTEYRFYLNHDNGDYWLMRKDADKDGKPVFSEVDDVGARRERLPEPLEFKKPKAQLDHLREAHFVSFYPGGACDYATITIALDRKSETKIMTKGRLGQMKVESD